MENYSIFSNTQKDFSKIITVLENFDEQQEVIMAIKNDYWELKSIINNLNRMNGINSWHGIIDGEININSKHHALGKFYDHKETELLLKHLYINLLLEFDNNFPKFSYHEEYKNTSTWAFWELLDKK